MTDAMSNKGRNYAFRDELVLFLHENGFPEAARAPEVSGRTIGQQLLSDVGDIAGIPWALSVHKRKTMDLSQALAAAEWKAVAQGAGLFAAVHHRRDYALSESYVTMPLRVFARVLELTPPPGQNP